MVLSQEFKPVCDVRQSGVLSPILLAVYAKLRGCKLNANVVVSMTCIYATMCHV